MSILLIYLKDVWTNISKYYIFFVEIELENIEAGDQADDQGQKNVGHPTETVSDTDSQILISSMENQNEIFSVEDDSPLVEDNISQSKSPNNVLLPENSFCLSWRDKISFRNK